MALLEVDGLVKYFGRRLVVNGVSFEVNAGEVVGLLGPNGAGKTTSFRVATGQIAPNGGRVTSAAIDSKIGCTVSPALGIIGNDPSRVAEGSDQIHDSDRPGGGILTDQGAAGKRPYPNWSR